MSISEEKKEFEENMQKSIFDEIQKFSSRNVQGIECIKRVESLIMQESLDIPNAGITANNKLVELNHIFKNAGISMFAETRDYNGMKYTEMPLVCDAVVNDIMDNLQESVEKLLVYLNEIGNVAGKKKNQLDTIKNVNPITKVFQKIKAMFVKPKPINIYIDDEDQEKINALNKEYCDSNSQLENYNLEDRIMPAIVKKITRIDKLSGSRVYSASVVPGLVEKDVIPYMEKLGLEGLIPQLQEKLVKEYTKDLAKFGMLKPTQEDIDMYVPNFKKKSDDGERGNLTEKSLTSNVIGEQSSGKLKQSLGTHVLEDDEYTI